MFGKQVWTFAQYKIIQFAHWCGVQIFSDVCILTIYIDEIIIVFLKVYSVIKKIHFIYNTLAMISSEFSALQCSHQLRDPPRARLELCSCHECFFFLLHRHINNQRRVIWRTHLSFIHHTFLNLFTQRCSGTEEQHLYTNTSQFLIVNQLHLDHKISVILISTPNCKLSLVNQAL